MKQGRTIDSLVAEVERQFEAKKDVLATTRLLQVHTVNRGKYGVADTNLDLGDIGEYPLNNYAHGQLASYTAIPKVYYDRMRQLQPNLLDQNINTWLRATKPEEKRLVRVLDGNVRAVLSDRYRTLDNIDLVRFVTPVFQEFPDLTVVSCEITERRIYIKVSMPSLVRQVKGGKVIFGAVFENSEIGAGRFLALPYSVVLDCTNGAKHEEWGHRRNHVGRQLTLGGGGIGIGGAGNGDDVDEIGGIEHYYSDEAREADDRAFFLKVRDTVRAILSGEVVDRIHDQMQKAAGVELPDPEASMEVLTRKAGFTEDERKSVFAHLILGRDASLWGLANAVTRAAQDVNDYDRATEFEALGGRLIDLSPDEYKVIVRPKEEGLLALPQAAGASI